MVGGRKYSLEVGGAMWNCRHGNYHLHEMRSNARASLTHGREEDILEVREERV